MRRLIKAGASHETQKICAYFAGVAAWIMLVTGIWITSRLGRFVFAYFSGGIASAEMPYATVAVVVGGMGVGMIVLLLEVVSSFNLREFFINSLFFRSYEIQKHDLEMDLEQNNVYSIYEEYNGNTVPRDLELSARGNGTVSGELIVQREAQEAVQALSIHREEELGRLALGEVVDISETWTLNRYKRSTHPLYANVTKVEIAPDESQMSLLLAPDGVYANHVADPDFRIRFLRQISAFLHSVCGEPWLAGYSDHFIGIALTCSRDLEDTFGHADRIEFLRVTVTVADIEHHGSTIERSGHPLTFASVEWLEK